MTRTGRPYFDIVEAPNGTIIYRGYCVDLIDALVKHIKKVNKVNLEYEFYIAPENDYGIQLEGTKKWNGIIGELMEHVSYILFYLYTFKNNNNN